MPQGDIKQTYKSNQFRHENVVPNELMTVEYRSSDPTDLTDNPKRIWANLLTNELKYTTDGITITTVASGTRLNELAINVKDFGARGNGVNDDTLPIQNALNVAGLIGSTVFVPRGTYIITQILQQPSSVTLSLDQNAIIRRGADINAMIINKSAGVIGLYGANERIKIIGGTIDGNRAAFPNPCTAIGIGHANDILISGVKIINVPIWHMIELNAVKNARIEDCTFDNNGGVGTTEMIQIDLMLNNSVFPWFGPYDETICTDITIEGNHFINGVDGIGTHTAKLNTPHTYIWVLNNRFETLSGSGIKSLNYSNVLISGNQFTSCQKGVFASTQAATVNRWTITENTFITITQRPIQIGNAHNDGLISNNSINGAGTHGIGVDMSSNWVIEGNNVQGCGQSGIWSYASNNVIIENNISVGNNTTATAQRYDISVGFLASPINQNNKVIGNHCGTFGMGYTNLALVTLNHITISLLNDATTTNEQVINNFIAGTWTP